MFKKPRSYSQTFPITYFSIGFLNKYLLGDLFGLDIVLALGSRKQTALIKFCPKTCLIFSFSRSSVSTYIIFSLLLSLFWLSLTHALGQQQSHFLLWDFPAPQLWLGPQDLFFHSQLCTSSQSTFDHMVLNSCCFCSLCFPEDPDRSALVSAKE